MSNWKDIWEKRTDRFDSIDNSNKREMFLELKRIDGFDVVEGGISYEALLKQNSDIISLLSEKDNIKSIFDVGCGSGANMFLFMNDGLEVGGMDYSSAQIEIAKKVFKNDCVKELICDEAKNIPTKVKYDAIVANSVFSYFPNEEYAKIVLNGMLEKANKSIGIIDVHDIEKKNDFKEYRRKTVDNYDEKYAGLDKLFYSESFFASWAKEKGLEVKFSNSEVEGYWNNDFVFNVFFFKG